MTTKEGSNGDFSRLAYTVREAAEISAVSPFTIRKLVRDQELEHTRVGRRILVTAASLRRRMIGGNADAA